MFKIGDKIVYPMHGAGVIEAIEDKVILGQSQSYYIVRMPINDMKIMVPRVNVIEVGVRPIICRDEAEKVLNCLVDLCYESNSNWNKRYRENMVKIKSGNIYEVAEVVKMLMIIDRSKGLSTGERKMLSSAKQILISELVLAKECERCDVERCIEECINM